MLTESTAQKLGEAIKTNHRKQTLIKEIEDLIQKTAATVAPTKEYVQEKYPILYQLLIQQVENLHQIINQEQLLILKKNVLEIPEVDLLTPPISAEDISSVENIGYKWCKEAIDKGVVVKATPSENIVSGVAYSYEGFYRDATLDKLIRDKIYEQL